MNIFDENDIKPIAKNTKQSSDGNNCDIFEPSVYEPDHSKFRANYIKSITPKITAEVDNTLIDEEAQLGDEPAMDLEVSGTETKRHFKFIPKHLRGPRGFNGSVDNFVVLSESEYSRLKVKDPNKFYFIYENEESADYIEDGVLMTTDSVVDGILVTNKTIQNKILIL